MESDPSMPWFIALAVIAVANLLLAELAQRRLKAVSAEGWINAGSWSLFMGNSIGSGLRFMRFIYGRESYADARLHWLKWGVRMCHVLGAALFVNLLLFVGTGQAPQAGG